MLFGLLLLVALLLIGVPVFWTFLGVTVFLVIVLGYDPAFLLPYGYSQLSSPLLLAIPMFIIAGKIIERGGLGDVIVDWADSIIGRVRGGLGVTAVLACGIFGSISGSALAALSTIGSIMFGRLERAGYPRGFVAALLANASILGLLIPPSGIMILYAWAANVSVLASFLATLIPGLILMVLLSVINVIQYRKAPVPAAVGAGVESVAAQAAVPAGSGSVSVRPRGRASEPKVEGESFGAGLKRFGGETFRAIPALLLPVIILGGIYGGLVTVVEAAVVAALYAVPLGLWVYRRLELKDLKDVLIEAATTTGVVMVMAYSIMILSRMFTMERLPSQIQSFVFSISDNPVMVLILVNVFMILMGMLIDDVSGVLLLTPVLLPVVTSVGVDPIHFAAILGVNLGMANVTPPTAPLLYFGGHLARAPINEMMGPALVMIFFAWIPTLLLTTYIPDLSLMLPRLLLGY